MPSSRRLPLLPLALLPITLLGFLKGLSGCGTAPSGSGGANSPNNLSLGVALAQTSNIALIGQEQVNGIKVAQDYINQQGGVGGQPLTLVLQDAGGDEATAINAFQTLINTNQVAGIIGPTTSQQAFGAAPVAERARVPMLAPSTIAPGIPQLGVFVSRLGTDASFTAPVALQAALKLDPKIKTVAMLYAQDQEAMVSESKFFQKAILATGLKLLPVQKFHATDTDFQSQAAWLLNQQPQLVVISGLVVDGGNLVKQLRQLGYKGLIVGGNGLNTSNVFPVCQSLCDGILVAQAYSPTNPSAINQTFVKAFRQQYKKQPPLLSAQAFASVQVFAAALQAVNAKTPIRSLSLPELRQRLNGELLRGTYETPLGKISFTADGDIVQKDFFVAQVKMQSDNQGEFVFLK